ncbi:ATP-binding cassette domain-containing protein, partial [Ruminococcaceae bacterium OttesenSCG-928-A11]|nr:ATP-binding cassette domain-containing protein [Ruminococcaceae bacterium OttesenSCG-928-A11]
MLEVSSVTKHYRRKTVLDGVSLALQSGQCLGVAGHNGSGKSTLLSIVAQVLPPDSGGIACDGHNVLGNRQFLRTMVGY